MNARLVHRLALLSFSVAIAMVACARADAARPALSDIQRPADLSPTASSTPVPTALLPAAREPTSTADTLKEFTQTVATVSAPETQILGLPNAAPTTAIGLDEIPAPRLVIPALNLDRDIVKVPARKGQWDLTQLGHKVGWLETTGEKPGDSLAMAFVGHVTVSAADMGPFANLWKLNLKDEVIYRTEYIDYVYSVKYKIDADPSDTWRLYVKDKRQLLLVTCEAWDYATWTYGKRLIVGAEAIAQRPAP